MPGPSRRPPTGLQRPENIVKLVFGAVGVVMCLVAVALYLHTRSFIASASRAPGTVIELIHVEDDDGGRGTWRPLVRFQPPSGEVVEFSTSSSSNPPSYHVGEVATVFFDPADPQDARLDGYFSLWGVPTILAFLGAVFLLVSLIVHLVLGRKAARANGRHPR